MTTAARTALADQLGAAVAEATRRQRQIAHREGMPLRQLPGHPWITAQIRLLTDALLSGTARLCPHIGASPLVLHGAVWAPGHLVCAACITALRPAQAEDGTCDHCRRPCSPIYPGMAQSGLLLLAYGLCHRCARRTGLGRPRPRKAHA
ncbi:hypothetical protein [Streptosporangium sandarakinum]